VHFNKGFRPTWFGHSVPIIYFSNKQKRPRKDPLVERIRKNAIITASRFTAEAEKESVLGFWKTYLEAIQ